MTDPLNPKSVLARALVHIGWEGGTPAENLVYLLDDEDDEDDAMAAAIAAVDKLYAEHGWTA